ncbi:MAG: GNAT family N-acetyltransferase [Proteobacteria bacterium]|nr:GNAT family N-acetyltransferase [Pseudomonadota bacterium]MBS0462947.1 GNAT family N-acetyltransferase [Pseudomonadota bacterium]
MHESATAWLDPVTLASDQVRLEPLAPAHSPALCEATRDGQLWNLWYTSVPAPERMDAWIASALADRAAGTALPFVVRDGNGVVVGSTRYCNADAGNRRLEIGHTWYAERVQRSGVNTQAKWLLLRHAFETLGCIAVEFRTHWCNLRSRAAIARLGAKQDGVLRNHRIMPDGSFRDTVVFSIVASEWPAARAHLQFLVESGGQR